MALTLSGDGSIGPLSATEVGYLDGVTSAVQGQIDNKIGISTVIPACRVFRSGAQGGFPSNIGTSTAILWDAEDFDPLGMHSTSSNTDRLTIPEGYGGLWRFDMYVTFQGGNTGQCRARITASGGNGPQETAQNMGHLNYDTLSIFCSLVMKLSAGQYVQAFIQQSMGSTLSLYAGSWLSAVRIGA